MGTNLVNGDGLPFPEQNKIDAWRNEAAFPDPNDWRDFIAMFRHAAEIDRKKLGDSNLPDGLMGCEQSLRAVIAFLQRQPDIARRKDIAPLMRLHAAIVDLAEGRTSPLFKPVQRKAGSPGKGVNYTHLQGLAARGLSELIDGGVPIKIAAGRIAHALKANRKDMAGITDETIINWREQILRGIGRGAPENAWQSYLDPFPPNFGNTPLKVGNSIVKLLKGRGGALG